MSIESTGSGRAAPDFKAPDEKAIRRVVISALVGASVEWYDFFL